MSVSTQPRPAKPRTNTAAHPMPGTGQQAAATGRQANPAPNGPASEFANDPFIRRLASPQEAERVKRSRRDIVEGLKVLEAQRKRAEVADEFYDGTVGMVYASMQVRKLLAKQGMAEEDIPDFNYASIPVDEIADRLQIAAVKVAPTITDDDAEGDDTDDAEDEDADEPDGPDSAAGRASADEKTVKRAEKAVKLLRKNNRLDIYEKDLHRDLCKHGDVFLFLWPRTTAKGKIVSVDFRVNTAHTVACVYDAEDPLRIAYVIKSWETPSDYGDDGLTTEGRKPVYRANLYYPGPEQIGADGTIIQGAGRIERWVTEPGTPPNKPESWKRVHEADDIEDVDAVAADEFGDADDPLDKDDIPSPFGLTWFHFRNGSPCGKPEHVNAYGPQTLINKLVWSFAGNVEYQGFPQRYILQDPKVDDPLVNDIDPDHPEDEDDDPETETGTSALRADPAAVWKIWGKATGQYSAADPATFLQPFDRFIKSMAELCKLPLGAFTKNSADFPSGDAAREMNGQMHAKVIDRKDRVGPEWEDAYELALRMLGIEGVTVDIRWAPTDPINSVEGVEVLKAKRDLGVPDQVLLNEAGYPDDQIEQWLKSQEGLSLEQRIALLVQVGTAVQALAAGVTAGVVPDNMTQAFVARMLGNLAEGTADAPDGPDALPAPSFRDPPPVLPPGGMLGAGAPGGPGGPGGGRPAKAATSAGGGKAGATARTRQRQPSKAAPKKAMKAAGTPVKATKATQAQGGRA